ncbi:MAG TPA: PilZ domain-containing protein [Terriglobales bacterium]
MFLQQGPVSNNGHERRTMRRFAMRLPASVRVSGIPSEFPVETENVSARGIFFYIDRRMTPGARVEVTMSFPPQVTLSDPLRVRFIARVLRVEALDSADRAGVAAMIEEYEFLQPAGGMRGSASLEPSWHFGS